MITEKIKHWRLVPDDFVRDVLTGKPLPWQVEAMQAVAKSRSGEIPQRRIAIKSAVGVGKTTCVAWLILWHLVCFPDSKIACTAPTEPQLKMGLWPECSKWIRKIPDNLKEAFPFEMLTDKITFLENFAMARTARAERPESFQGIHSTNVMLIADEASAVAEEVYMAGQGVMSSKGAITILIGNPTRNVGTFYDAFHSDSHMYWTKTVSAFDSSMVTEEFIREMGRKHGEESYEYLVRVLGQFCLLEGGTIIPMPWLDAAVDRNVEYDGNEIVWGVDVSAGTGRDKSAIAKRAGNILLEPVQMFGNLDVLQFAGKVFSQYRETPSNRRPEKIFVDTIGVGQGTVVQLRNLMKDYPCIVKGINVSEAKNVSDRYKNLRVQLWARGRDWFESQLVRIPRDKELMSQLSSVEWEDNEAGKYVIKDKSAGLGYSPDAADAFLLTFAGDKRKSKYELDYVDSSKARGNMQTTAISSASYVRY